MIHLKIEMWKWFRWNFPQPKHDDWDIDMKIWINWYEEIDTYKGINSEIYEEVWNAINEKKKKETRSKILSNVSVNHIQHSSNKRGMGQALSDILSGPDIWLHQTYTMFKYYRRLWPYWEY